MKKYKKLSLACLSAALFCLFAGCSSERVAPTEPCRAYAMTADGVVLRSSTLVNFGIQLRNVSGGKKTDVRRISNIGNVGLRKAMEYSLSRCGIFSESGEYVLDVELAREDARRDGSSFSVEEHVRYSLSERQSGKRVFERVVVSGAQASAADAPLGARLRTAKERAMKMNIESFLGALDRDFLRKEQARANRVPAGGN